MQSDGSDYQQSNSHQLHAGIQALQQALAYARRELDASGLGITWLDEYQPGHLGLPFSVDTTYGVFFQHRLEHYLEQQTLEMGTAVKAVLLERMRRRAARSKPNEE